MNGQQHFKELLEAYLAGKTNAGEHAALMQLIKSGRYDELLKQRIDEALQANEPVLDINEQRAKELLGNILSAEQHTAKLIPLRVQPKTYRAWYIAAAAVLLIAMATWMLWQPGHKQETNTTARVSKAVQPVTGSAGKKYMRLPDSSTVLLNAGSELVPGDFSAATREVTLTGEAYFDIRHNASKPFIVHTGTISTTVMGTAFNIKAYPGQNEITVTVTRGKVQVSKDKKTIGVITPNESISVNLANKSFKLEKVNADEVVEWKKQYLVLDDISLEDAAILINNKYHVNISISRDDLKDCRFSATFLNNETLEQVLDVVTGVVNASYKMQPNDQVIISGEGCH